MDALPAISALAQVGSGVAGIVQSNTNQSMLRKVQDAEIDASLREAARMQGAQRAAFAKSGVDVGSGTPLDVLAETAAESELSALRIKYGYQAARMNQHTQGLTALTAGLAKGSDTLLTAWGRREVVDPDVGTMYRRPTANDMVRPSGYRKAGSGWPTVRR